MGPIDLPRELEVLVLKSGLGLGGLTQPHRELALAVAALALPADQPASEPDVNALLKRVLAEEGAFIDTDHVELRRWLVDTGWWQRDGFGRAYARTPSAALRPELRAIAQALGGLDLRVWVTERRDQQRRQRAARRAAWAGRGEGVPRG